MRGSPETANRRYHDFVLRFEPNEEGRAEFWRVSVSTTVRAYGWKDALNQADRAFGLDRVRFITHPSNPGVAAAYMVETGEEPVPGTEVLVGQVTAERA